MKINPVCFTIHLAVTEANYPLETALVTAKWSVKSSVSKLDGSTTS